MVDWDSGRRVSLPTRYGPLDKAQPPSPMSISRFAKLASSPLWADLTLRKDAFEVEQAALPLRFLWLILVTLV